jgi:hypothetical protein
MNEERPLLVRLNWYWICQLAGWSMIPLLWLASGFAYGMNNAMVLVCAWGGIGGVLLSDLWHRILKRRSGRFASRKLGWKHILPAVLLLGVVHTAWQTAGFAIFQPYGAIHDIRWLPGALVFWWGAHLAWNVFYMAVLALRRANRFEAEALRLEISAKDAELRALQAQVNPHFFFNSLNSVRALIYEDTNAASRMIDQLAALMRYALQSGQSDTVPLAAELEAVQAYLAIEKIRFEERMQVSVEVDAGLEHVRIPPMSLQTLVENAVKYGVEASASGSEIRIRARRSEASTIVIEIANLGAIVHFANSTKVGLTNTRKRLALALGSSAHLDLSESSGWVRATLTVPEAA